MVGIKVPQTHNDCCFFYSGALAACSYIANKREKIFQVLYKALNSKTSELQEVAHDCMKKVRQDVHF